MVYSWSIVFFVSVAASLLDTTVVTAFVPGTRRPPAARETTSFLSSPLSPSFWGTSPHYSSFHESSNNVFTLQKAAATSGNSMDVNDDDLPPGPVKLIIAGAPASGKGTQCEVIKEKYGVVHLSTGDMLRAAVAAGSDVGKQAKAYMDSGKLVPDEVIIGVVRASCPSLGVF
jgi:hypothetical protein